MAMKITHIYHSAFSVELETCTLLFDWYKRDLPAFDPAKTLYVFASHEHPDHYAECIWPLREQYPDVIYILDEDAGPEHTEDGVYHVTANRSYTIGDLHIETLLSTDEGVAFYIEAEGRRIYHSGDLNIWSWEEDSDARNEERRQIYRNEISALAGKDIEAAFVPFDWRLGENGKDCILQFMDVVGCKHLFPMHYWGKRERMEAAAEKEPVAQYRDLMHFDDVYVIE